MASSSAKMASAKVATSAPVRAKVYDAVEKPVAAAVAAPAPAPVVPFEDVTHFEENFVLSKELHGQSIYFDVREGSSVPNLFKSSEEMRQAYHIKPVGMAAAVKPGDSFEINLEVTSPTFTEACGRLDGFVLGSVYSRCENLLPSKASLITSVDVLRPMYHSGRFLKMPKAGAVGAKVNNGQAFPMIKLRIRGHWAEYVESTTTRHVAVKGKEISTIDTIQWKPRFVPINQAARETRFYLFSHVDKDTGKDVYRTTVTMSDGRKRLVGPQDSTPGSSIMPVFSISHVYLNEGIGVTATARALYIRHASKAVERVEPEPALDNVIIEDDILDGEGEESASSASVVSSAETGKRKLEVFSSSSGPIEPAVRRRY